MVQYVVLEVTDRYIAPKGNDNTGIRGDTVPQRRDNLYSLQPKKLRGDSTSVFLWMSGVSCQDY
jgi:hypothetical protein